MLLLAVTEDRTRQGEAAFCGQVLWCLTFTRVNLVNALLPNALPVLSLRHAATGQPRQVALNARRCVSSGAPSAYCSSAGTTGKHLGCLGDSQERTKARLPTPAWWIQGRGISTVAFPDASPREQSQGVEVSPWLWDLVESAGLDFQAALDQHSIYAPSLAFSHWNVCS